MTVAYTCTCGVLIAYGVPHACRDTTRDPAAPGFEATPTLGGASPEGNDGAMGAAEPSRWGALPGGEDAA